MPFDWDKLRIFHAVAAAGSFTRAGDVLHLSQSAISRQISALEHDVGVALFHRHARGLILTEQGEMLFDTAKDVLGKLEDVRAQLSATTDEPKGALRVTTTVGLGSGWLSDRVHEFIDHYPDIMLQLFFSNEELDLTTRQADCAIRLQQPQQPDLIQRRLFTVHFHLYASPVYIDRFGAPQSMDDLDAHRLVTFGDPVPSYLRDMNWLETRGGKKTSKSASLQINDLTSIRRAVQHGAGIAMLPDYIIPESARLIKLMPDIDAPSFDTYFCYPESLKNQTRLKVFRDFLFDAAKAWSY